MTLRDEGKVIIEVGINEGTMRSQNPHVAYSPAEIAADAIACSRAGAAVAHWHARNEDGSQAWSSAELCRETMALVAAASDIVMYPTYFGDLTHVWALSDEPPAGARLEMAPFDVFQEVGHVMWDAKTGRIRPIVFGGRDGEGRDHPEVIDEFRRRDLALSVAIFELGDIRWTSLAARFGHLPQPVHAKFFVSEQWLKGPVATPEALRSFLSQWPSDVAVEATVVPLFMADASMNEELLRVALDSGAHIRVGIGDSPDAFPDRTNVELVEWAVGLVRDAGLEVASPADVRRSMRSALDGSGGAQ